MIKLIIWMVICITLSVYLVDLKLSMCVFFAGLSLYFYLESHFFWKKTAAWTNNMTQDFPFHNAHSHQFFSKLHRKIRKQDQKLHRIKQKNTQLMRILKDFPESLIVLNANLALVWYNQCAIQLLDLDKEKDKLQAIGNLLRRPEVHHYLAQKIDAQPLLLNHYKPNIFLNIQSFKYDSSHVLLWIQDVSGRINTERMRSDFIANVSHELRTPLSVLMGSLETLHLPQLPNAKKIEIMHLMENQSQRMLSLVTDLLDLAKLEAKAPPAFEVAYTLNDLWEILTQETKLLPHAHHINIHPMINHFPLNDLDQTENKTENKTIVPQDILILGEATEILSSLTNVLRNAMTHAAIDHKTPLSITLSAQITSDQQLKISIKDNGKGIAEDQLSRITERFYQVSDAQNTEKKGTGLGLAIVKHCMNRHDGKLLIQSKLGQGSCFSLIFPAKRIQINHLKPISTSISSI